MVNFEKIKKIKLYYLQKLDIAEIVILTEKEIELLEKLSKEKNPKGTLEFGNEKIIVSFNGEKFPVKNVNIATKILRNNSKGGF